MTIKEMTCSGKHFEIDNKREAIFAEAIIKPPNLQFKLALFFKFEIRVLWHCCPPFVKVVRLHFPISWPTACLSSTMGETF